MRPSASTAEIRAAYRALAQRLHPDRLTGASDAERSLAERRMREINESWDVVRDPARRQAYDEARRGQRAEAPAGPSRPVDASPGWGAVGEEDLVEVAPEIHGIAGMVVQHLPWVVVLVALAAIFVGTAYATSRRTPATSAVDRTAAAGECVDVSPGPSTTVVPCDGPHDLEIVTRVDIAADCPTGTEVRRLAGDGRLDCVREG